MYLHNQHFLNHKHDKIHRTSFIPITDSAEHETELEGFVFGTAPCAIPAARPDLLLSYEVMQDHKPGNSPLLYKPTYSLPFLPIAFSNWVVGHCMPCPATTAATRVDAAEAAAIQAAEAAAASAVSPSMI